MQDFATGNMEEGGGEEIFADPPYSLYIFTNLRMR